MTEIVQELDRYLPGIILITDNTLKNYLINARFNGRLVEVPAFPLWSSSPVGLSTTKVRSRSQTACHLVSICSGSYARAIRPKSFRPRSPAGHPATQRGKAEESF